METESLSADDVTDARILSIQLPAAISAIRLRSVELRLEAMGDCSSTVWLTSLSRRCSWPCHTRRKVVGETNRATWDAARVCHYGSTHDSTARRDWHTCRFDSDKSWNSPSVSLIWAYREAAWRTVRQSVIQPSSIHCVSATVRRAIYRMQWRPNTMRRKLTARSLRALRFLAIVAILLQVNKIMAPQWNWVRARLPWPWGLARTSPIAF